MCTLQLEPKKCREFSLTELKYRSTERVAREAGVAPVSPWDRCARAAGLRVQRWSYMRDAVPTKPGKPGKPGKFTKPTKPTSAGP